MKGRCAMKLELPVKWTGGHIFSFKKGPRSKFDTRKIPAGPNFMDPLDFRKSSLSGQIMHAVDSLTSRATIHLYIILDTVACDTLNLYARSYKPRFSLNLQRTKINS